jgi:hypothetical protein
VQVVDEKRERRFFRHSFDQLRHRVNAMPKCFFIFGSIG